MLSDRQDGINDHRGVTRGARCRDHRPGQVLNISYTGQQFNNLGE